MRVRRNTPEPRSSPQATLGHLAHKLSGIRPIAHDEDERQSTADRETYHSPLKSLFEPVPTTRAGSSRASRRSSW